MCKVKLRECYALKVMNFLWVFAVLCAVLFLAAVGCKNSIDQKEPDESGAEDSQGNSGGQDGQQEQDCPSSGDVKTQVSYCYYESERMKAKAEYLNGSLSSLTTYYDADSQQDGEEQPMDLKIEFYDSEGGQRRVTVFFYDSDGNYMFKIDGPIMEEVLSGAVKEYDMEGSLQNIYGSLYGVVLKDYLGWVLLPDRGLDVMRLYGLDVTEKTLRYESGRTRARALCLDGELKRLETYYDASPLRDGEGQPKDLYIVCGKMFLKYYPSGFLQMMNGRGGYRNYYVTSYEDGEIRRPSEAKTYKELIGGDSPAFYEYTFFDDATVIAVALLSGAKADDLVASAHAYDGMKSVGRGTFSYNGKDGKRKEVKISDFYMGEAEVTQALYESVMGTNPSNFKGDSSLPVENISWYDAVAFCNRLSVLSGLEKCYSLKSDGSYITCDYSKNGYRLPTEDEWRWAFDGGSKSEYYVYSGSNRADDVAWYRENSEGKTHPIKQKKPNELGLYDMSGNVYEWCWDVAEYIVSGMYSSTSKRKSSCIFGGSWNDYTYDLCPSFYSLGALDARNDVGFRFARSIAK